MSRRFACINIHLPGGEPRALGMIHIEDTLDAERAAELLSDKLAQFNLKIDRDIVATTTDGVVLCALWQQVQLDKQIDWTIMVLGVLPFDIYYSYKITFFHPDIWFC